MGDDAVEAMLHEYDALREEIRLHKSSMRQHYVVMVGVLSAFAVATQLGLPVVTDLTLLAAPLLSVTFAMLFLNDGAQTLIMGKHLERLERRVNARLGARALLWESGTAAKLWRLKDRKSPFARRVPPTVAASWLGYGVLVAAYLAGGYEGAARLWAWRAWAGVAYGALLVAVLAFLAIHLMRMNALMREGGDLDAILDEVDDPGRARLSLDPGWIARLLDGPS